MAQRFTKRSSNEGALPFAVFKGWGFFPPRFFRHRRQEPATFAFAKGCALSSLSLFDTPRMLAPRPIQSTALNFSLDK